MPPSEQHVSEVVSPIAVFAKSFPTKSIRPNPTRTDQKLKKKKGAMSNAQEPGKGKAGWGELLTLETGGAGPVSLTEHKPG